MLKNNELTREGDLFHLTLEVPILCSGKHPPRYQSKHDKFLRHPAPSLFQDLPVKKNYSL
jgi:hypothetical protein